MQTEESKEKKKEAKCCGFKEIFKDFQKMCDKMSPCFSEQNGTIDCAAIMKSMMKSKMES